MSRENITFRIDGDQKIQLDRIAAVMDRDRSYVINEAIANYLEVNLWLITEIEKGVAEANMGDFATDAEANAILIRLQHEG